MKVLLRQSNTHLYYAAPQKWTADEENAFDFEDVERAIKASHDEKLTDVEVVLGFGDGRDDPVLQINPYL
jgi:hypothetical protein